MGDVTITLNDDEYAAAGAALSTCAEDVELAFTMGEYDENPEEHETATKLLGALKSVIGKLIAASEAQCAEAVGTVN